MMTIGPRDKLLVKPIMSRSTGLRLDVKDKTRADGETKIPFGGPMGVPSRQQRQNDDRGFHRKLRKAVMSLV
jgi:hypothetical protein